MYKDFLKKSGRIVALAMAGTMLFGRVPVSAKELAPIAEVQEVQAVAVKPLALESINNSASEVQVGKNEKIGVYLKNNGTEEIDLSNYEIRPRCVGNCEGMTITGENSSNILTANGGVEIVYVKVMLSEACKAPIVKFVADVVDKTTGDTVFTTAEQSIKPYVITDGVLKFHDTSMPVKYQLTLDLGEEFSSEGLIAGGTGNATEIWENGSCVGMYLCPGAPSSLLLRMNTNQASGKPELIPASAGTISRQVTGGSSLVYHIDLHAPAVFKIRTAQECVLEHSSGIKFVADGTAENDGVLYGLSFDVQKYEDQTDISYVRENIEPIGEIQAYTASISVPENTNPEFKVKVEGNAPRFYIPIPKGWDAKKTGLFIKSDAFGIYETTGDISEDGSALIYYADGFNQEFRNKTVTFGLFQKSTPVDAKLWKQEVLNYLHRVRPVSWMTGTTYEDLFFEKTPLANLAAWYTLGMGDYSQYQPEAGSSKCVIPYEVFVKDAQKYFGNLPDMKKTAFADVLVYDEKQNAFVYMPGVGGDKSPEVTVERVDELGNDAYAIRFQFSDEGYPLTKATLVLQDNKEGNWRNISFLKGYPEVTAPVVPKPEQPKPEQSNPEPQKPDTSLTNPNKGQELSDEFIGKVVESITKVNTGSEVTVAMNGATKVPAAVLETVKGKDVSVVFDMGGYSWKINGKNVTAETLKEIDLKVTVGTNNIPSNVVQTAAKGKESIQLSLAHNGVFGFKADLSVNVGIKNKNKATSLYYYNEQGKMELVQKATVNQSGVVTYQFEHASEYAVVLDNAKKPKPNKDEKDQVLNGSEINDNSPETADSTNLSVWIAMMMLSAVTVVLGIKKRRV